MSPRPTRAPGPDLLEVRRLADAGRHEAALGRLQTILGPRPAESNRNAAVVLLRTLAREALAAGDPGPAVAALAAAARLAPGFADVHFQHALALLEHQQRAAARRALEQALRIHPGYLAARLELALLDAREGLLGDALERLRAMSADPRLEEPGTFRRGMQRLQQAEWDEAGSLLRRALRLREPALEDLFERYQSHMEAGEAALAADAVRAVLPRHAGYPDLHFLLAGAELRDGHADDAIASLARALELHPDFHAARLELARALEMLGQVDQAREQVTFVLDARPDDPLALEMHARWTPARRRERAPVIPDKNVA